TLAISNTVISGYYNLNYYGSSNFVVLTNYGTVRWAGGSLSGFGQTLIYNAGLWQELGDHSLDIGTGTNLYFFNVGTFLKSGGTANTSINWQFNTTGTLNTLSGSLV